MALANQNLGNGSVQDDCRTEPLGGIPGFPALDFNAANVNTALVETACHFELAQSTTLACTRDKFGNFSFLNPSTTRQYCFQVSSSTEFPIGTTTVALQLRDDTGNIGPRYEFVVIVDPDAPTPTPTPTGPTVPTQTQTRTRTRTVTRTATSTSTRTSTNTATRTPANTATRTATNTATHTPTPVLANVTGAIRYYASSRAVPNASVSATGSTTLATTTLSTGAYTLANLLPGTITVEPRKVGDFGSPVATGALDAAWVLQVIAGMRTFDARQRLACDVTGNGSLSALDAANILQRQVGLLTRFSAATRCDSDWLFDPVATPGTGRRLITPLLSSSTCRRGAIAYEPLTGNQTQQDFVGILFGDCTGNWAPPGGAALSALAPGGAPDVRLRVSRRTADGLIRVPIAVDSPWPFSAVDITIGLGPGLRAVAVRPLRAAANSLMISNLNDPGRARIALASGAPLDPAAILVVDIEADENAAPDVRLLRALVDDEPAIATTGASRLQE